MNYLTKNEEIVNVSSECYSRIGIEDNTPTTYNVVMFEHKLMEETEWNEIIETFDSKEEAKIFINWLITSMDGRPFMLHSDFLDFKEKLSIEIN